MNWLNLSIHHLTCHEFLGCEPVDRATWLCLLRYCAQHETGGVIHDCREWGERKWMQLCGVTRAEVDRQCALWRWVEGNGIEVAMYPIDQERVVKIQRAAGKKFGRGKKHPLASPEEVGKEEEGNSKEQLSSEQQGQSIGERIGDLSQGRSEFLAEWNAIAERTGVPKARDISDESWRKLKLRLREGMVLADLVPRIEESDFVRSSSWFNLWWLAKNGENWRKLRDGSYAKKADACYLSHREQDKARKEAENARPIFASPDPAPAGGDRW